MPFDEKKKKEYLLVGGLGIGGIALATLFFRDGSTSPRTSRSSISHAAQTPRWTPNPNQSSLDQSIIAAKASALQAFDTAKANMLQTTAGEAIAFDTNKTNQNIAYNATAAQTAQDRISSSAQESIASTMATAQEETAQSQASAMEQLGQSQQQTSWWQSLFGSIPFLGSLFGGGAAAGTGAGLGSLLDFLPF